MILRAAAGDAAADDHAIRSRDRRRDHARCHLGAAAGQRDRCRRHAVSVVGFAMPVFWLGQMLMLVFSTQLGLFPAQGMLSLRYDLGPFGKALDIAHHLVLPAVTLAFFNLALIARLTRANMLQVLRLEYIIFARSKGLSERTVVYKHALRNAVLPVVTIIGLNIKTLITGAVLTETVFAWPGLGRLTYRRHQRARLSGADGDVRLRRHSGRDREPADRHRLRVARSRGSGTDERRGQAHGGRRGMQRRRRAIGRRRCGGFAKPGAASARTGSRSSVSCCWSSTLLMALLAPVRRSRRPVQDHRRPLASRRARTSGSAPITSAATCWLACSTAPARPSWWDWSRSRWRSSSASSSARSPAITAAGSTKS